MQDEIFNTTDEKRIKSAQEKQKNTQEQQIEDVRFVLSTKEGRRFYWRQLSLCGVFTTSFTGNSTTFFNEGARSVGLRLLSELNLARPEAYLEMIKENK